MKKGIEVWTDYDPNGIWRLNIRKKRGQLTLDEITEAATEYEQDFYMLVLKCMDEDVGQYYFTDDLDGDFVQLYSAADFFKWRARE